ncbi:MAG: ABC transporter permease [Eubacteriales bacterium]|nr:ABC transporter permease [Eubacteriales bacterium]MDD3866786.1 ABC transporter permease [Eubacteriales bacterium]MDD4462448.1 ABC transporter permease [Eubacteriales bacterium]
MIELAKRQLLIFFRDKSAVFFSLLSVFIIIALYALFLGDVWANSLGDLPNGRQVMDAWIIAGILAVTSVTATMGAFGIMIEDRSRHLIRDFYSSPIPRSRLMGGYIIGSFVIGLVMSLVALVLSQAYLLAGGGQLLPFIDYLKILGVLMLTTLANTSMLLFMVAFFSSLNAFSTASTIIGTLIGFVAGIYLPVGQLPEAVRLIVKLFPVSYSVSVFRQIIMRPQLEIAFAGVPLEARTGFEQFMGVTLHFSDWQVPIWFSLLILAVSALVFMLTGLVVINRRSRR